MFISNLLVCVYTYVSEFCACEGLENYLKDRMKKNSQEMSTLSSVIATNKFGKKMIGKAVKSKKSLEDIRAQGKKVGTKGIFYFFIMTKRQGGYALQILPWYKAINIKYH